MNSRDIYDYVVDLEARITSAKDTLERIIQVTHKYGHPGTNLTTHKGLANIRDIAEAEIAHLEDTVTP